jgi:type I restriction enzyme M protein
VIGLGPSIFYGTQLAACVLVFRASKAKAKKNQILFIDASEEIRVGRAQNFMEPEHVDKIFKWYDSFKDVEGKVKLAFKELIAQNDFNLNIPLYVEKVIEDKLPSVENALNDLKQAWSASVNAEEKFKRILKQFI